MRNRQNPRQSPQTALAKSLLLIVSLVLLIANVSLMVNTRVLAQSYSDQQNQATWFLFQLSKELSELVAESNHMGDGDEHLQMVWLKYDLAWSRFDLLITSKESDNFMEMGDARNFFEQLFTEYRALEDNLKLITNTDLVRGKEFNKSVKKLYVSMIDYVNQNFRVKSPLYQAQQKKAQSLQLLQVVLFVGFMLCLLLISVVFYKESRYHHKLAMTDALTNLGNRLALFIKMQRYHDRNKEFTVYLLDLDGFKGINDQFGHQEGDRVLVELADHLNDFESEDYRAYRMGGDEFAILHRQNSQQNEVLDYIDLLSSKVGSCFAEHESLGVSVGVASFPKDAKEIDELIGIADKRMYQMKFYNKQDKQKVKKQV